jgi:hypothetical protein
MTWSYSLWSILAETGNELADSNGSQIYTHIIALLIRSKIQARWTVQKLVLKLEALNWSVEMTGLPVDLIIGGDEVFNIHIGCQWFRSWSRNFEKWRCSGRARWPKKVHTTNSMSDFIRTKSRKFWPKNLGCPDSRWKLLAIVVVLPNDGFRPMFQLLKKGRNFEIKVPFNCLNVVNLNLEVIHASWLGQAL